MISNSLLQLWQGARPQARLATDAGEDTPELADAPLLKRALPVSRQESLRLRLLISQ